MSSFNQIRKLAAARKGGEKALLDLLPKVASPKQLAKLSDDRVLSEMTKRIFCSGFSWTVIKKKWGDFEEVFLGFDPSALLSRPTKFWDGLTSNPRIVRNGQKIASIQKNAQFITDITAEHGSFGTFLSEWPTSNQIGLMELLNKRGARLGGHTGQYFLRFVGKDGFLLTPSVVLGLQSAGLEIANEPTTKKDLARIQEQFNTWATETQLPYAHISEICALSVGDSCSEMHSQEG